MEIVCPYQRCAIKAYTNVKLLLARALVDCSTQNDCVSGTVGVVT
jgi:hypothetical protein